MDSGTMLAAVVEASGELTVHRIPLPAYGPYQALVKMRFGATCAGTDLRLMQKRHPNPITYPAVLGHESVGTVLQTGDRVRSFSVGDLISRVGMPAMPEIGLSLCWGGFCQYGVATDWQAMQADGLDRQLWEKARVQQVIPADIAPAAAPMIITWRETLSYYNRLGVREGQTVLIAGSGANALAFLCHATYAGVRTVTLGNAQRGADALRLGSDAHIDYRSDCVREEIASAFPHGIDCIIDAVGNANNVNMALPHLNRGGTIAVYGWNDRSGYGINPFLSKHSFRVYTDGYDEPETHAEIIARIRQGKLRAEDWYNIAQPVPLLNIAEAYENLRQKKAYKYLIDLE